MLDVTADGIFGIDNDWIGSGGVTIAGDEVESFLVGEEDAARNDGDGTRKNEVFEKSRAFVDLAITSGVFEDRDATGWLIFASAIDVGHVASHFADPHAAFVVEGESDGFFDEGFGRYGLDDKSILDRKGLEGLIDSENGSWRDDFCRDDVLLCVVIISVTILGQQGGEAQDG